MEVFVNGERRELHVYDRINEADYTKSIVCSEERIDTDELGRFCMEEEDFTRWQRDLAVLQNSEDMRFFLKDRVDYQELDNYIYEETRYITSAAAAIKEENISLKRLERALCEKDAAWLRDNGFIKTEI
ncbi:hypothetical protein [Anaeroglobus geminatus]|jgi:hypothetical protein|uniref:Uncharacterized protein n=1 Tax=Anaeroglobus geminatus F0357 TaxID=861450 RepID=G9YH31_9FIRM|nr:hypothetical protein [Anaeroglobus geminatus]EHM41086.1 hypothetical protein HMPREF0080_00956 [Anaeroglobus geminatus F0357]